jgi:hypothetical protein
LERLRRLGVAGRLALGCLVLIALACGSVAALIIWLNATTRAGPAPAGPAPSGTIDVSGACQREEVEAYIDGQEARLGALLEPLSTLEGASGYDTIDQIDLEALRKRRDDLASAPLPECLDGWRDEEVALADLVIRAIERAQSRRNALDTVAAIWMVVRETRVHVDRMHSAEERLRQRFGIPEPTGEPPPRDTNASAP